ncbi:MAG: formate--tetrahydrofolate ligase [Treponemataceae bacterium]
MTDIEIVQKNNMEKISSIAGKLALSEEDLELYGQYKAKISFSKLKELQNLPNRGKLILVTAITPTPAGEGKSTISIGLADAVNKIGKKAVLALREPSLGPCFGVKGGACGGGYAQIVPMEDINLHFTGDIHAVSISTNLIASLIDNSIHQGNPLGIDPRTVSWKRCVDLNDRVLRKTVVGLGGKTDGIPREQEFSISVASEIMAILCLSKDIPELKKRIDNIVVGYTYDKRMVKFSEFGCTGAVAALLKDAVKPNLVQTLEKNPVFVHGGPFANIAHGCNSINATNCALKLSDYVITEAGFAADLGAEKFLDIKCRSAGIVPSAVVIVATIRALKMHGGVAKSNLSTENIEALIKGIENLKIHIQNMQEFGLPVVVAVNKFVTDSKKELETLIEQVEKCGVSIKISDCWGKGGEGAKELAFEVVRICNEEKPDFKFLYPLELGLKEKIEILAKKIYRAGSVEFSSTAIKKLDSFTKAGYGNLPICTAKTQNSISHDSSLFGAPKDYVFPVRDVQLYAGAGFVVALSGDIMTMPGLPKVPAAFNIDVDENGVISGLF